MQEPWITSRPDLLGGKACVRGTRLSVEILLELLATGATRAEILAEFPQLPEEGLEAAIRYGAALADSEDPTNTARS